jgi:hypothetical protein
LRMRSFSVIFRRAEVKWAGVVFSNILGVGLEERLESSSRESHHCFRQDGRNLTKGANMRGNRL